MQRPETTSRESQLSKHQCKEAVNKVIQFAEKGNLLYIFDLETTGLSKKTDRILSFSAIAARWNGYQFCEETRLNLYSNPGFHIPEEVSKINHITDDIVADACDEDEAVEQIEEFLGPHPLLCGYNSDGFDIPFLGNCYLRATGNILEPAATIDVMKMAKELLDLEGYKLEKVAHETGADIGIEFHNSMDDVVATFRILNILISYYIKEDKEILQDIRFVSMNRFRKSHTTDRLYFYTKPFSTTFYDLYRGEWRSSMPKTNLMKFRDSVLRMLGVCSEKELESRCRKGEIL